MNRPHVCGKRAGLEKNARVRWLLGFVLFAITLASAPAQDLTSALIPPSKPVAAGSKCGLSLFCMNNSPVDITATFPRQLTGEFSAGSQRLNALLLLDTNTLEDDTVTIQSGSFAKREYVMEVPSLVTNQLVLTISNYTPIIIIVGNAPAVPHVTTEPPPEPVTPNLMETNQQHFSKIVTHFSKYLTPYEPIYFLLGTYPASEFQFSLKYQLFDTTNRWLYPASRLHFAYTQTSFWDLFSKDPSFYDTSYKPSAFFYFQDLLETRREQDYQLDFQTGYEHESNGRGGTDERSQNTAYVQPTLTIGLPEDFQVSLYPRAWVYIFGTSANNPDIADYRGHADFVGTLSWRKNYQLTTKFTIGDHPDRTSVKLDFSFALPRSTVSRRAYTRNISAVTANHSANTTRPATASGSASRCLTDTACSYPPAAQLLRGLFPKFRATFAQARNAGMANPLFLECFACPARLAWQLHRNSHQKAMMAFACNSNQTALL